MNPRKNSNQIRNALPATALTIALLAGGAAAQQQQQRQQQQDQRQQQQEQRRQMQEQQQQDRARQAIAVHAMADDIVGKDVVDPRGESLGSIDDLVVDLNKGKAAYAVLAFGGTLGFNRDKVAVPMHAFSWDQREERFVLNTTRERLENAPEFDEDDLDKISEEGWLDRTRRAFGMERDDRRDQGRDQGRDRNAGEGRQDQRQIDRQQQRDRQQRDRYQEDRRDRSAAEEDNDHKPFAMASDIDDIKIVGSDGEEIGSISDLVVDRNSGNVAFATLNSGGVMGIGSDTHLIPWEALERKENKKFQVSIASDRFEDAPKLEDEEQLRDTSFVQSVYSFYQVRPDQRRDAGQRQDDRREREERRQQGG